MTVRPLGVLVVAVAAFLAGRASDGVRIPDLIPDVLPNVLPTPAPIAESGLFVMVVREATEKGMTTAQLSAIDSGPFADYLTAKKARWRKFDKDVAPDLEAEVWRKAWAEHVVGKPDAAFPLLIVSNGKAGEVTNLPADLPGLMAVVTKYGGQP